MEKKDPKQASAKSEPGKSAEKRLMIDGYQDADGLKRVVEYYFENISLAESLFDPDILAQHGMDVDAIREIEEMVKGINMPIFRVEFIPDMLSMPNLDPQGRGGLGSSGLEPGLPSRGSLFSHDNYPVTRTESRPGYEYRETTYSDGSTRTHKLIEAPDGTVIEQVTTTNADGSESYYFFSTTDPDTGGGVREERRVFTDSPSMAEQARQADEPPPATDTSGGDDTNDGGDTNDSGDSSGGDTNGDDAPGTTDVDQYQPAEGSGHFCPLFLDICRREMEDALSLGQAVRVGVVLINPGDPDALPLIDGSRLVFDPQDLVINPNPAVADRRAGSGQRTFRLEIPVRDNPAGPRIP